MATRRNDLRSLSVPSAILFVLLFVSCVPSLPIVRDVDKRLSAPDAFPSLPKTSVTPLPEASATPLSARPSTTPIQTWTEFFHNENLASLIEASLQNNQELKIVEQEIYIANNEFLARQGEYLPKVDFQAGYEFEKVGKYTSQGVSDEVNHVPTYLQVGRIGLVTQWEVDIWSRLRNASKAAYYSYLSSIEGKKVLVTHLVAEIANVYFELMALDNQAEIVHSYVEILRRITEMVKIQQSAAKATSLAVRRFEAEVLKNESRQYQLQQQITVTQNKLNALVGRFPKNLERDSKKFLNLTLAKVDTGVPADLLDNRPDVKAAALDLEAAKLSVSSAKARFYPALSIEGGVGFESFNSEHFLDVPESIFYNLFGKLTAPLLNRKAIKAAYFTANNKQIQAVYRYEQTLVGAYAEVVNQLNSIKNLNQMFDLKFKQVAALNDSITISNMLFRAARVDYIEALMTQRDALEAQIELIEVKKQELSAYVDLYKSLGGGWRTIGSGGSSESSGSD